MKHTGRVADQRDWLSGIVEGLKQCDRHGTLREVPHGSVPANVEHGVKIFCLHIGELDCLRKLFLCSLVLLKSRHRGSLIFRQITLRIDGGLASLWRSQGQLDTRVPENKVRGRKLFQPEPGLTARVAKLIVRS